MPQLTRRISFIRRCSRVSSGSAAIHSDSESCGASSSKVRNAFRVKAWRVRPRGTIITAAGARAKPTACAHTRYSPARIAGKK